MAHIEKVNPEEAVLLDGGSAWMPNGRLIGDRVLPESVQSRRRRLRSRLSDLREPLRTRRQELVPGPDVVGMVGNNLRDLRDRFTARDGLLSRIRSQREGSGGGNQTQEQGGEQSDITV